MRNNRLREIRKQKGLTQQELAERLGLSQAQVARLESGYSEITIEYMRLFAQALDCEPWELLPLDMQPKIDQKDLELLRLLKSLSVDKNSDTSKKSKVG